MGTLSRRKPRIFISHSHHDNTFGYRLLDDLRRNIGDEDAVWYDLRGGRNNSNAGLRPGDHWRKVIDQQLRRRNVFILLLSHAARKSRWVDYEIDTALGRVVAGKMRIITIHCDDCIVPDILQRYHIISCLSPEDYKAAFDDVLRGLGLQAEPTDPKEAMIEQVTRQIQTAFDNKDWPNVISKTNFLIDTFPDARSSSLYCMQGLALLETGETQSLLSILDGALVLTRDHEQCLSLLEEFTVHFMNKDCWDLVLSCATRALRMAPNHTHWLTRRDQALIKLGSKDKIVTTPIDSPFRTIKLPNASENTHNYISEINDLNPMLPLFNTNTTNSESQMIPLSNEARTFDDITLQIIPHRHVQQIFRHKSSASAFLLNVTFVPFLLAEYLHRLLNILNIQIVWGIAPILLLLFLLGWLTRRDWLALLLSVGFGILWSVDGYYVGHYMTFDLHIFAWTPDTSTLATLAVCMISLCLGWYWHHDVFRGNKQYT